MMSANHCFTTASLASACPAAVLVPATHLEMCAETNIDLCSNQRFTMLYCHHLTNTYAAHMREGMRVPRVEEEWPDKTRRATCNVNHPQAVGGTVFTMVHRRLSIKRRLRTGINMASCGSAPCQRLRSPHPTPDPRIPSFTTLTTQKKHIQLLGPVVWPPHHRMADATSAKSDTLRCIGVGHRAGLARAACRGACKRRRGAMRAGRAASLRKGAARSAEGAGCAAAAGAVCSNRAVRAAQAG